MIKPKRLSDCVFQFVHVDKITYNIICTHALMSHKQGATTDVFCYLLLDPTVLQAFIASQTAIYNAANIEYVCICVRVCANVSMLGIKVIHTVIWVSYHLHHSSCIMLRRYGMM